MSSPPGRQPRLYVLAAPSGGGKTSLVQALLQQDDRLRLSVSHSTRPPRPGERDGEHYHFVEEPAFLSLVEQGAFLEYARVFGHLYGTGREAVEKLLGQGYDVLLDIDWQGARQVRDTFPDSRLVFILPPSLEALRKRLSRRGQDSEEEIRRRMRDARAEISHWDEFDFVIINDDFSAALQDLQSIILNGKPARAVAQKKIDALVADLLQER